MMFTRSLLFMNIFLIAPAAMSVAPRRSRCFLIMRRSRRSGRRGRRRDGRRGGRGRVRRLREQESLQKRRRIWAGRICLGTTRGGRSGRLREKVLLRGLDQLLQESGRLDGGCGAPTGETGRDRYVFH